MGRNIYRRKDGRYEGRVLLGKDESGKRIYKSFYGKTAVEVELKLSAISGHDYEITDLTVKDIILEYLTAIKPQIKESTWANYRMKSEKHIIPVLGNIQCCMLNVTDIHNFIDLKKRQKLSSRYIADVLVLLKSVFRYASKLHNFQNPLENYKIPRSAKCDVAILSKPEQERLIRYIHNDYRYLGITIALYTGMRIGEICAMQWADIDFENSIIHVRKTLQRIPTFDKHRKSKIVITEPKSASSMRDIPIPKCLIQLFRRYRNDDDVFVISGKRKPVECRTLQYRFANALNNANLPSVHFHSLRHAFATNCITLGFDVKTLSELLGHSSVEITMNRYVHSDIERKRACMSLIKMVA